ncbi:LysR substrate-binding domain-containing protein [Nocardia coffeae]|uniref:LysR substrate-binding domain-containing protein n=1 Tax=Nocardia coffeae TaxID=2873381 RepID=UPI0027DFC69F|nr:LysR substrate-binding domain-containing protein [Nocardia coffeae]
MKSESSPWTCDPIILAHINFHQIPDQPLPPKIPTANERQNPRAVSAVLESRVLRVAVHGARIADANLMRFYLDQHPDAHIELTMMTPSATSRNAVIDGRVDAAFARAHWSARPLPAHITALPAYLDTLHLLVGRDHWLAGRDHVELAELDSLTAWVPGAGFDSEVGDFHRDLSTYTGVSIDTESHPAGIKFDNIVERISHSTSLVTFGGEGTTTPWHANIRRIPIRNPTPAYPISLLLREMPTPHAQLTGLTDFVTATYNSNAAGAVWLPEPDRSLFGLRRHP